ncbi:syntaxin [Thalassiosira pseudonana CCMP1335]|uniref:Syntaxin n=1 Tax=Thalassiosira pseudonana TaxID=35128 RepID=B8CFD9_THAPS|nr:syntaxin [Thalassiosira pseudonana CCMP1335]EED87611.1 syntaxin [Thalassiosira pseudonana CCMP1335]
MMMKQQDQGLEMLGQSAERLSQISMGIHEELGNQNRCVSSLVYDLEAATTNLNMVTLKTKELIQKSGGKRNFIIIVMLSLVVVVLLFLILYS